MQPEALAEGATTANSLEAYASYPFASDETYQEGLRSILAGGALDNNPPVEVREEILRRTRVFYFNKVMGYSITVDDVREYENSRHDIAQETPTIIADENRVLTLSELKDLIESGRVDQIPNNKVIPEVFSEAPLSESITPARKKPWEAAPEVESLMITKT